MALRLLLRFTLFSCLLLGIYTTAWATHNRAGEIVVEMVPNPDGECAGSLTVKVTIVTYTRTSSVDADRDSLTLCYGDGFCEVIARTNGPGSPPQGEPQENDIKFNFYEAFHTYNGYGQYTISFEDMNRNAGIRNVNYPNSVSIPLYLENVFSLVNPAFSGCNNSPILQVPPIDFACLGEIYTHNPGAFDPDGDSLVYELRVPEQGPDDPVPQYFYPAGLTINRLTGDVIWDAPNEAAEFNIAISIISFRNGSPIDTMVRDMQIIVEDCENDPPELLVEVEEICVVAGEVVDFEVIATAPLTDISQRVQLVAYGAPLSLPADRSPATFLPNTTTYQEDPLRRQFRWETTCDHISNQPYNIVFRAVDDFLGDTTGLATLKTVRIKVIGPPPEDVQAEAIDDFIDISWELPYICEGAADDYFRGFTVWRRINSDQMPFDTCSPGLDGRGYTLLTPDGPIQEVNTDGRYFYQDNEVERGRTYCYRVLAIFARRTANGLFFYNSIESLPSNEACVQLGRDLPLLVKVDVMETDFNNGSIDVCWSKPNAADLDTVLNAGPYVYELQQASGQTEDPSQFQTIATFTSPTFAAANDTCFTDTGLNTIDNPYTYRVNFYVNNETEPLGEAIPAASLYLNASPTDRTNILSWDEFVPWENFAYTIFRENTSGGLDSITTVGDPIYRDEGLMNGQEYCYVVRSRGTYNIDGLPSPLLNRSQRVCSVPIDNVPPCPPVLTVTNLCDDDRNCDVIANLENSLSWESAQTLCPEFEDVAGYRIYYAPTVDAEFSLIATIDDPNTLEYIHRPGNGLAGCYAVTAIDTVTVANESDLSNTVCVDNCPFYTLPNAFTPNGDGQNELYVPIRSCFIESVEFQVFNRWGSLVFETNDPNLNWDGTNTKGDNLADGTYFYRCQVFENRVEGVVPAPELLSGYIELLRGAD